MAQQNCGRTAKSTGEPCQRPAGWGTNNDSGPCKFHGGAAENQGAPEGNDNAVTVEAWSEDFVQDFLTEAEQGLVDDARELLADDATAQELGSTAAAIALVQFRRTGDQRFLHRFESICDTFGIAPADELELSGGLDSTTSVSFEDEEAAAAVRKATLEDNA